MPTLLAPYLLPVIALIAITPDPVAIHLGPIPIMWYGVCYAIGLAATYFVITREARRRGLDARLVDNGIIIVAAAALIGGRLYHVIDQWHLYADNPIKIFLPPYSGLGVYGGIITGTITAFLLTRYWKVSFLRWADVIAPGLFVMQAIGRWGNFFNQELYGHPTDLPWGIAIDCAHRIDDHGNPQYPCPPPGVAAAPPATYPVDQGFHPLFLYESISGILGAITLLWIARRWGSRMRPGDLLLLFFIWYGTVRFLLEPFRTGNWTFNGLPTAMIISGALVLGALAILVIRHGPWAKDADRWGEPPQREDDGEVIDEDEVVDVLDGDEIDDGDADAIDDALEDDDLADDEVEDGDDVDDGDGDDGHGDDGAGDERPA